MFFPGSFQFASMFVPISFNVSSKLAPFLNQFVFWRHPDSDFWVPTIGVLGRPQNSPNLICLAHSSPHFEPSPPQLVGRSPPRSLFETSWCHLGPTWHPFSQTFAPFLVSIVFVLAILKFDFWAANRKSWATQIFPKCDTL